MAKPQIEHNGYNCGDFEKRPNAESLHCLTLHRPADKLAAAGSLDIEHVFVAVAPDADHAETLCAGLHGRIISASPYRGGRSGTKASETYRLAASLRHADHTAPRLARRTE